MLSALGILSGQYVEALVGEKRSNW